MLRSWPRLLTSGSACGLSSTVLAAVLAAHVMADGRAAADLAEARLAIVLADGAAAADLAFASAAIVLADGAAAADGASASYVTVLADRGAAADLARASNAAVLTDGGAAAALARASSAVVLADARAPAFSAQVLFTVVRALLADRGHSPLGSSSYVTKVSAGDHSPCLCLRASHQLRPTRPQLVRSTPTRLERRRQTAASGRTTALSDGGDGDEGATGRLGRRPKHVSRFLFGSPGRAYAVKLRSN